MLTGIIKNVIHAYALKRFLKLTYVVIKLVNNVSGIYILVLALINHYGL